jgi:hypothetical protein
MTPTDRPVALVTGVSRAIWRAVLPTRPASRSEAEQFWRGRQLAKMRSWIHHESSSLQIHQRVHVE